MPNHAAYREPDIGGDPVLAAFRAQLSHTVAMPATPEMRLVWSPYKTGLQRAIEQVNPAAPLVARIGALLQLVYLKPSIEMEIAKPTD